MNVDFATFFLPSRAVKNEDKKSTFFMYNGNNNNQLKEPSISPARKPTERPASQLCVIHPKACNTITPHHSKTPSPY